MRLTEKLSTTSNKFIEFINELGFDFLDTQKMVKNSLSNTIDDLLGSAKKHQELADLISKQIKKIKDDNFVEKTRIAQQIMNQYSNNASTVSYDLSNNLRNLMQKAINHYELSYIETSNKFSKPVIGSIWPKVNEWLEIVNESSLIETIRTHEISLSLSHEAIDNIFENLRNSLVTFAENDITTLTQKIIGIQTEIKEYLESYSISNYRIVEPKFNFTGKYDDLIKSCLRIETPYQGSYPKKNFRGLIFEMRSFSMMFLLLLSSFGINRYIAHDERSKTIVYIISLVLIVIGVLATFANAQDSKEDKLEEELKKGRDRISAEIKRAINEFISEWRNFVFSNFKTEMADISAEVDRLIREDSKKKNEETAADRLKLNMNSQMLDLKDRTYQDLLRKCETLKQQFDALVIEILKSEQSLSN